MATIWRCSVFSVLKLEKLRIHPVKQQILSNDVEFRSKKQKFTILPDTTNSLNNKQSLLVVKLKNSYHVSRYLLITLALILLAVIVNSSFPYPLRASCLVQWQFAETCDLVVSKLREQIEINDELCDEDCTLKVVRIELKTNEIDDINIIFANYSESSCMALAASKTRNWYRLFDGGRNYCNLYQLIVTSGYDSDDFFEVTENAICTQYDMAHCG